MSIESPNWYRSDDRELYYKLIKNNHLSKEEDIFVERMYHMEECASRLDGDIE